MKKKTISQNNLAFITIAIGLVVNIALASIKLNIGLRSNSLCILSDAINNFLDTLSCIIAGFAFYFIGKKNSDKFPFGYGRLEYVATLGVSILVVTVGAQFAFSALERFLYPNPIYFNWLYFGVIIATIGVKLGLGFYYKIINKRVQSTVVYALMLDSFLDVGITTMAVISFVATAFLKIKIDAIFGLIISVLILVSGAKLVKDSLSALIGKKPTAEVSDSIAHIVKASKDVVECGELLLHNYGSHSAFATIGVAFNKEISIEAATSLSEEITKEVVEKTGINLQITLLKPNETATIGHN